MKALLIIAPKDFRDEEYFHTKEELEKGGLETATASSAKGKIRGMLGGSALAELTLDDVNVSDYDAIVFIGGSGSSVFFNDESAKQIAKDAAEQEKVLAAICIAPTVLANAGLLNGKRATAYPSQEASIRSSALEFTAAPVEVDGKIVTADGPSSAGDFAKAILGVLES